MKLYLSGASASFFCLLFSVFSLTAQSKYTLQRALQVARSNNPTLKTAQFNMDIAEADIVSSKLRPNPSLNNQTLQLSNSKYFADNTNWNNARNRQVWWQLTKPFQLPDQRKYRIEVAQRNFQFNTASYTEIERNLYLDVASKWLEVWASQKQLEIIQIAKANIDTLVKINRVRLKNQVISQTDVIRTELLADQYGLQYQLATQESINRYRELKFLLGAPDSVSIEMGDTLIFNNVSSLDSLTSYALNNRADMQAAKSQVTIAESNIKLQKSLAIPQPVLGAIWNPQNTVPYVGFFGTIDIPAFSHNQGEIQKAGILKQQGLQNILTLESQIETQIATSYNSFLIHQQNLQKFTGILRQSQTILNNVRYAYLRGGTTIVDFLEAQRSWLETQQQYYDTFQQYRLSYIQLLYSTGLINQLAQ